MFKFLAENMIFLANVSQARKKQISEKILGRVEKITNTFLVGYLDCAENGKFELPFNSTSQESYSWYASTNNAYRDGWNAFVDDFPEEKRLGALGQEVLNEIHLRSS